jgi:hypothetical protein
MDTSAEVGATDTLGRRTGPRQKHTIGEKRRMVEARTPKQTIGSRGGGSRAWY